MTPQVFPPLPPLSFGALLKRARRAASLTQEVLGAAAGYTAAYISALEHGERVPPPATAELLAGALQLEGAEHATFLQAAAVARQTRRQALEADGDEPVPPVGAYLGATPEGPLVARAREIELLDAALTAVLEGAGRVIMLAGEPGIGKTRLAQEVALRARARGALVATGRCYEPLQAVAFAPFVEALGMVHTAAPATVRSEVAARWPEVRRLLPDTTQPLAGPPAVSERDAQQRLFWQVTGFVQAVASARPVALLVDDVHWADETSLGLLLHLARHTRGAPVLLLGTYRDVELSRHRGLQAMLHALGHERLLERVLVQGLEIGGLGALVAATLTLDGTDGVTNGVGEAVLALLQRTTEGNPYFAQELLRMLIERGELAREAATGRWECRTAGELDVPETVRDAIAERVGRLRLSTQEVLRAASVLGQVFTFAALCQLRAEPPRQAGAREEPGEHVRHCEAVTVEVEEALEEALQAGLLRETQAPLRDARWGAGYGFRHALTHRAVYAAIPALRRRGLHRAAGAALEQLALRGRGHQRPAAEVAQHFLEGDAVARALPYVLAAGDQAERVYAHVEAEQHYRRALELARALGDQAREVAVLEALARILHFHARYDEELQIYEQVVQASSVAGDIERVARLTARMGEAYARGERAQEGIAHLRSAIETLGREGLSAAGLAWLHFALASLYFLLGRHAETLVATEQAVEFGWGAGDGPVRLKAQLLHAGALAELGRVAEAIPALQETMPRAEAASDLLSLCRALVALTQAHISRGELDLSKACGQRACVCVERLGDVPMIARTHCDLGDNAYWAGNWAAARVQYERGAEALRQVPRAAVATFPALGLGRLGVTEGRWEEATRLLGDVLAHAGGVGDLEVLARAQGTLAEWDLAQGHADSAHARLVALLDQSRTPDEGPLPLPLLWLWAWACLACGDTPQATATLTAAVTRARAYANVLALGDALRVEAMLAARQERWEDAQIALEEALAVATPFPYPAAKALFVYGQLHVAHGEPARARERLTAALAILKLLGERLYAAQVEQALAALDHSPSLG